MDWFAENVLLSYWHKPAKTELLKESKPGNLKRKPNDLKDILTEESFFFNLLFLFYFQDKHTIRIKY